MTAFEPIRSRPRAVQWSARVVRARQGRSYSSMCGPILMYASMVRLARLSGTRTHARRAAAARRRADRRYLLLQRSNVEPFTDKQIELATTFADQAVIAIENVRLFDEVQARTDELRESLQQQTATSDVLKVISRSTFDLQTVLDTLVASACQLCEADSGNISRPTSEGLFRFQAHHGMPPAMVKDLERRQIKAGRGTAIGRVLLERTPAHIEDVLNDPDYELVETSKLGGYRTLLAVPLLREGEPIGVFVLVRRVVRPFTERADRAGLDLRRPGGDRDRERAAVRRNPGQEPPARRGEPAQVAVPRQHEPRAAHAAQRHPRVQ